MIEPNRIWIVEYKRKGRPFNLWRASYGFQTFPTKQKAVNFAKGLNPETYRIRQYMPVENCQSCMWA